MAHVGYREAPGKGWAGLSCCGKGVELETNTQAGPQVEGASQNKKVDTDGAVCDTLASMKHKRKSADNSAVRLTPDQTKHTGEWSALTGLSSTRVAQAFIDLGRIAFNRQDMPEAKALREHLDAQGKLLTLKRRGADQERALRQTARVTKARFTPKAPGSGKGS